MRGVCRLWPACGADDHEELAAAGAAGQGLRLHAQLLRQTQRKRVAAGREVHRGLGIREAVRSAHLLDRVAERLHMACDLARVVEVAAAVEDVDVHAPRWGQNDARRRALTAVSVWDHEERCEEGDTDQ